jgi:hypothetical protein
MVAATLTSALMAAKKSPDEFAGGPWPATVRLYREVFAALSKETTGEPNP